MCPSLVRVVLVLIALGVFARPAGADDTQIIADAVKALRAEFDAARSRKPVPLRTACDYFPDPAPTVSADVVLLALRTRQHPNRTGDAYIKWQLTALLPGRVDPAIVPELQRLLGSAAGYEARPGMDATSQSAYIGDLNRIRFDERDHANAALANIDARFMAVNAPVLEFRSALLRRLPPSRDAVALAIQEMQLRSRAGIAITDACRSLLFPVIREWAQMSGKPEELQAVSTAVHKLAFDPAPRWVSGVKWESPDQDREIIYHSAALNDGDAQDLTAFLKALSKSGLRPGELKLKPPE